MAEISKSPRAANQRQAKMPPRTAKATRSSSTPNTAEQLKAMVAAQRKSERRFTELSADLLEQLTRISARLEAVEERWARAEAAVGVMFQVLDSPEVGPHERSIIKGCIEIIRQRGMWQPVNAAAAQVFSRGED